MNLHGHLTVKSSAYRYLTEHVDPRNKLLVFLWGSFGPDTEPRWLVSVSRRSALPPNAAQKGQFGELMNGIPFLIVQPEHAPKLDGCTLVYEADTLVVRTADEEHEEWREPLIPAAEPDYMH